MNNTIKLIREIENPLFYICSVDVKDECKFGNRIHKIFIKKGDIVPNFYKSTCHMIEKRGKSKGKLLGIRKEYLGYSTKTPVDAGVLESIVNKTLKFELEDE